MSEVKSSPSEFVGMDQISSIISHAISRPLLKEPEIELETLRELVEKEVPLDEPLIGMLLSEPDLVSFAYWADEPDFVDSAGALLRGEQTYDKIIRDGFWRRVWTWLDDFDWESEHMSMPGQRLAIAEIHVPHIPNCVGTFATTRTGALDVSIKAFGLGYQKVKRVDVNNSYELPGACGALTTGVQFVVHVWKHKYTEKRRALIHMISIDGILVDEPLDSSVPHLCGERYRQDAASILSIAQMRGDKFGEDYSDVPMHHAAVGAVSAHKKELEKGLIYSASLELPITWFSQLGQYALPISNLVISIESRVASSIEMSWKVVSGHDYMWFRGVPGDMRKFWVWE
jgi:hypothetical protein